MWLIARGLKRPSGGWQDQGSFYSSIYFRYGMAHASLLRMFNHHYFSRAIFIVYAKRLAMWIEADHMPIRVSTVGVVGS